jgi:hypothetical protein
MAMQYNLLKYHGKWAVKFALLGFFRCNEGKKDLMRLTVSPRGHKALCAACLKAGTGDDNG